MDQRPIGIFDSGLGGLTAVREVQRTAPREDIVYFGDTGRVPYGTRGRETIIRYAKQDARFLLSHHVKLLLIACGTISSVAMEEISGMCDIPVLGVLESAAQEAASATKNGKIGVIGTNATISSGSYERLLKKLLPQAEILSEPCPLFVPLVENGRFRPEDRVARLVAEEYLAPITAFGADTLILGCTHYPLLKELISQLTGATLVDPGACAARAAAGCLEERGLLNGRGGATSYFVSDEIDHFTRLAGYFLDREVTGSVERIAIENY